MNFSISAKKADGILAGIALNLGCIAILLLIQECKISSHLPRSLISFNNILYVLLYKPFTFLVKSISKYFILFDATVNGTAFMIFFSDYSLPIKMQLILCIDLVSCYFAEFIY